MKILQFNLLFISFFLLTISRSSAQGSTDLVLTGSNSWIFHTPDDGRTSLYIAPRINSEWNWGLYRFDNNGLLITQSLNTKALMVNGNIKAKEIKVTTAATDWPDYVFSPGYLLPNLSDTEKFIQVNGHLPEVPKAAEVEANGIQLGEMNKILLKKVEELTLQAIEEEKMRFKQQQLIDQQAKSILKLEQRLDRLETEKAIGR